MKKLAFTMAGAGQGASLIGLRAAFTMAEILLSLTIIGVVAAITLPSLTGNINERTWDTQRKALYARMSQAIPLMGSVNGYADTETFVTAGLSKVLKINNICDNEHIADCGLPSNIITIKGNKISLPTTLYELNSTLSKSDYYSIANTNAAAFETQNSESVAVYYNPFCGSKEVANSYYSQSKMCANLIYDLNGERGPNTVGKDIGFMSILYNTDSYVVAPRVSSKGVVRVAGNAYNESGVIASAQCTRKGDDLRIPSIEELSSLYFNAEFLEPDMTSGGDAWGGMYWSGTTLVSGPGVYDDATKPGITYVIRFRNGQVVAAPNNDTYGVMCILR